MGAFFLLLDIYWFIVKKIRTYYKPFWVNHKKSIQTHATYRWVTLHIHTDFHTESYLSYHCCTSYIHFWPPSCWNLHNMVMFSLLSCKSSIFRFLSFVICVDTCENSLHLVHLLMLSSNSMLWNNFFPLSCSTNHIKNLCCDATPNNLPSYHEYWGWESNIWPTPMFPLCSAPKKVWSLLTWTHFIGQ